MITKRGFILHGSCFCEMYIILCSNIILTKISYTLIKVNMHGYIPQVKATPDARLTVSGLTPNVKYQFAVSAIDEHGNVITNSIGEFESILQKQSDIFRYF